MKFPYLLIIAAVTAATGFINPACAETSVDFSAYARSSIQIGSDWNKGETLYPQFGFAKHNRLQEDQYFELSSAAHLLHDSRFVFTVGNGGDTPHYSGNWNPPGFAVRNLYFALDKLPEAERIGMWFGSRMYRGNDIYLFDNWPVDDQNLLGGGVTFHGSGAIGSPDIEFAFGARHDSQYSLWNAAPTTTLSQDKKAQDYVFIFKTLTPTQPQKKLKTNLEFHVLPKANATYAATGYGTQNIEMPAAYGLAAGMHYEIWNTHTAFVRYAWGHVSGGAPNDIETISSPIALQLPDGTLVQDSGLSSKKSSQAFAFGMSNAVELTQMRMGVLYAAIVQIEKPRDTLPGSAATLSLRPMYYVTDRVHAGFELDGSHYFRQLTDNDIDYAEISPMIEYALNKNVFGSPKFRLIVSQAFYSRSWAAYDAEAKQFGEPKKHAFNVGLGFELWF